MKISVNMMVKNEEMFIGRAIRSVLKIVDEICIIDNMSTDNTMMEIHKVAKEANIPIRVESIDTDDLALMRNEAMKLSSGDWILIVDGDEVFYDKGKDDIKMAFKLLKALLSKDDKDFDAKVVTLPFYHFYGSFWHTLANQPTPVVRIVKNDGSVKWDYPTENMKVHEKPMYEENKNKDQMLWFPNHFCHYGFCKPARASYQKGVDYLKRGHFNVIPERDPDNPLANTEVVRFTGIHPSAMFDFPFYKYRSSIEENDGKLMLRKMGW